MEEWFNVDTSKDLKPFYVLVAHFYVAFVHQNALQRALKDSWQVPHDGC